MFKEKYEKVIRLLQEKNSNFYGLYKDILDAYSSIPQNMQADFLVENFYEYSPHPHHRRFYVKYSEMYEDNSIHGMEIKMVLSSFTYKLYIDDINRYMLIEPFKKTIAKIRKKSNISTESVEYEFILNFNGETAKIEVYRTAEEDKLANKQLLNIFDVNLNELLDDKQTFSFNP